MGHADGRDDAERAGARDQRVELRPRLRPAHRQGAVAHRQELEDHGADADLRRRPVRDRERSRAGTADLRGAARRRAGDLTLADGETSNAGVVWSKTGRGSYMPTPLAYQGVLYVLANNGLFDAYDLQTGEEIYRQRLPVVGSGFSASPVAADGKIYLVERRRRHARHRRRPGRFRTSRPTPMGELLMATPALSQGVMYVRSAASLFAVTKR